MMRATVTPTEKTNIETMITLKPSTPSPDFPVSRQQDEGLELFTPKMGEKKTFLLLLNLFFKDSLSRQSVCGRGTRKLSN